MGWRCDPAALCRQHSLLMVCARFLTGADLKNEGVNTFSPQEAGGTILALQCTGHGLQGMAENSPEGGPFIMGENRIIQKGIME